MVVASCRCSEYSRTTASSGTPSMPAGARPSPPAPPPVEGGSSSGRENAPLQIGAQTRTHQPGKPTFSGRYHRRFLACAEYEVGGIREQSPYPRTQPFLGSRRTYLRPGLLARAIITTRTVTCRGFPDHLIKDSYLRLAGFSLISLLTYLLCYLLTYLPDGHINNDPPRSL